MLGGDSTAKRKQRWEKSTLVGRFRDKFLPEIASELACQVR